ncbi:B-cell receptor CD22-like [Acanthochromis polyacanthus]|uniref:B-cell receptor CD22-like n=1 Tax=Acanthochromis polyacanthus TaxID=80966 RepID=UPI0022345D52|nr:B-cell receptor CD22-like [Acanthochromis polyacanthus]
MISSLLLSFLFISDSPWSPTINISGEVKEKKSVTISCSAFTPCPHSPPQLTWNLPQNSHSQIEENTDGTFTSKIQQSITLSHSHDGFNISCSATYPVDEGKPGKTKETQQTLSVPYAPKETSASISPSGLVSAGSWVNLTCSSRANPPVSNFSWFLKTKDGSMKVAEGHFYRFNVTHGGIYYCEATNILGNQKSAEIPLTVEDPPTDTSVLISPTDPVSVGSVVNLTCSCRANPPAAHFVWFMTSDGRLEMIKTDTQVYSFKVTSSNRDRLFYCGCRNHLDIQLSRGRQLVFEGDDQSGKLVSVQVIVKMLGILLLVSTLILFECFFRSKFSNKSAAENFEMSSGGTASLSKK